VNSFFVVPMAPEKGVQGEFAKAADRSGHLALKRLPAHLAIGQDREVDFFLQRDGAVHCAIFDPLELLGTDGPGGELVLGPKKVRRPKQASYDVGMDSVIDQTHDSEL
jgi:hypothetical protein